MSEYVVGDTYARRDTPRFEFKAGSPSHTGGGYPRLRSSEYREHTPGDGADTAEAGTQTDTGETDVPPGKTAAQSLGCTSCHQADAQLVGPPYRAVAQRYDGDKATILKRMQTAVNQGAQGNWSEVTQGAPMPPQPQAADREAKLEQVAAWIAGMAE